MSRSFLWFTRGQGLLCFQEFMLYSASVLSRIGFMTNALLFLRLTIVD